MLQVFLPKDPLAFSYAAYHGFGGMDVQLVHYVGSAHPLESHTVSSFGGDWGLRAAHSWNHVRPMISHI
jgi:hypothetical protein